MSNMKTRGFKGVTYAEVVRLSNQGWSKSEIAAALDMSGPTISYHRRRAFERGDLERYAIRHRLPEPAPAQTPAPTAQPLVIRVPAGVSVEVIQAQPVGEIALAT